MKSLRTYLSYTVLLLAGVWVLAFAVLPHHHDPDSGLPCLDIHHHHPHTPLHDDCGFGKAFVIELQREDQHAFLPSLQVQMLTAQVDEGSFMVRMTGYDFQPKPYAFGLDVSDQICDFSGRAPPVV